MKRIFLFNYIIIVKAKSIAYTILVEIAVLLLFAIITILVTYPLINNLDTFAADSKDSLFTIWILAWNTNSFLHIDLKDIYNANIFYPYPSTVVFSENMFSLGLCALPLFLLTKNIIVTYNLLLILSFILSGYAAYFCIKEIIPSKYAAVLGGFCFAFNPWRFSNLHSLHLLAAWWIPLCFWALLRYYKTSMIRYIIVFGIFFVLASLTSAYSMLFTASALFICIIALFFISFRNELLFSLFKQRWKHLLLLSIIIIPPLFVTYLPYLRMSKLIPMSRPLILMQRRSLTGKSFFVPPGNNLLWANVIGPNAPSIREGLKIAYVGIIPFMLSMYGFFHVMRKSSPKDRNLFFSFSLTGAMLTLLSFGPYLTLWNHRFKSPLLSVWLLPGFQSTRAPGRLALLLYFFIGIFVAAGIYYLEKKYCGTKKIMLIALSLAMMSEYISFPLEFFRIPQYGKCPPAYAWLAKQPKGPIMEVPLGSRDFEDPVDWTLFEAEYTYYSIFHWFPMLNGYSGFFPPLHMRAKRLKMPEQLPLAQAAGIKYLIIHKNFFAPGYLKNNLDKVFKQNFVMKYHAAGIMIFENQLDSKLPLFTVDDSTLTIPENQPYYNLTTMPLQVIYTGRPAIAIYAIYGYVLWYSGQHILSKEKSQLQLSSPITKPGDHLQMVCNTPEQPGSYTLELILPNNVRITKMVTVNPYDEK